LCKLLAAAIFLLEAGRYFLQAVFESFQNNTQQTTYRLTLLSSLYFETGRAIAPYAVKRGAIDRKSLAS
jgi:hypothetical protein